MILAQWVIIGCAVRVNASERVMVGDKLVQERRGNSSMGGVRKGVVVVVMAWSFILVWVDVVGCG